MRTTLVLLSSFTLLFSACKSTSDTAVNELAIECQSGAYSDGECDPGNNFAFCQWDGGDCCASTCDDTDGVADCGEFGYDCRDPLGGGEGKLVIRDIGDPCRSISNPFNMGKMRQEVVLLSDDSLEGRRPGFTGDATVRNYIEKRFECMGFEAPYFGSFQQHFVSGDGGHTANVLAVLPGRDPVFRDETIVIGAHHDHLGIEEGQLKNGANDNVSGIVALLAMAQEMKNINFSPRRTIVFAAFGSEEYGLEGSRFYVKNPPPGLPISNVVYMMNLDMLGTYDFVESVDAFGTFADTPARKVLDELLATSDFSDLAINLGVASPRGDSDYEPFCAKGIPYVYIEAFDPACWHEACDDADRMDYPHFSQLTKLLYNVAINLADTNTDLSSERKEFRCKRRDDRGANSASSTY